uniref:RRM domain-containing protein n=1 Tax=Kalanchoe fedtschenkoi TaxID=63787 RepID=A0A7N0RDP5_KALFE
MAVVENVESKMGSSDLDASIQTQGLKAETNSPHRSDGDAELKSEEKEDHQISGGNSNQLEVSKAANGESKMDHQSNGVVANGGFDYSRENGGSENQGFKRDMKELEDLLSKLNPMAQEFVPISAVNGFNYGVAVGGAFGYPNGFAVPPNSGDFNGHMARRKKNGYSQGKRRMNSRTSMAQREDVIRRTIYVSDIDQQVTEEQLAGLFLNCGQVVDCRICGDPNSVLRFAFLEFTDEESARAALTLSGTQLGYYPVKVMPSKTAIAPVNPTFLPRITQTEVKLFFEAYCGEVHRLRLLGDYHHSTRIAFVEFVTADSAIAALNLSGSVLGSLPIRVSPSKTPVRPRAPRPPAH